MADKTSSRSNPTLFLGFLFAFLAAMLLFIFATSLQGTSKIYVAQTSVPAYSTLVPGQNIVLEDVPEDSVTDNDLTEQDLEETDGALVTRLEILQGGRVDRRSTSASTTGSLAVVQPGKERVVALEATFKGAVAGLVGPGSVVDIYDGEPGEDSSGVVAADVKVLGVGQGSGVTSNLQSEDDEGGLSGKGNDATIFILVAVPTEDAGALVRLTNAALSLDPYKAFDESGEICDISECADRATASDATDEPPESDAADDPSPDETVDPSTAPPADEAVDPSTDETPAP